MINSPDFDEPRAVVDSEHLACGCTPRLHGDLSRDILHGEFACQFVSRLTASVPDGMHGDELPSVVPSYPEAGLGLDEDDPPSFLLRNSVIDHSRNVVPGPVAAKGLYREPTMTGSNPLAPKAEQGPSYGLVVPPVPTTTNNPAIAPGQSTRAAVQRLSELGLGLLGTRPCTVALGDYAVITQGLRERAGVGDYGVIASPGASP